MTSGLIVALDDTDLGRCEALAKSLADRVSAFKVGLTLFGAHGPEAILEIGQHARVFCDLKLHDIPQQVAGVAEQMARQGVWMTTVHASGGREMVKAAVKAASGADSQCLIAGVTVLTSLDERGLIAVGQNADPASQVERLAKLAVDAGARALVCSGKEIGKLRELFGPGVLLVVPGIRPAGADIHDQERVVTPKAAAQLGADYIVVGRPVTRAPDPLEATDRILAELAP